MNSNPKARGICPHCGQRRALTQDGVMRWHRLKRLPESRHAAPECIGSWLPPKAEAGDG